MAYPASKTEKILDEYRHPGAYYRTAVDLVIHVLLTAVLAYFFLRTTEGWVWPALSVLGGLLIDLDHFIDHFLYYGFRFRFSDFFAHRYLASGKCYIFLHSWEIVALMWILAAVFHGIIPLVSGMSLHLLVDQAMTHRSKPMYFFLFHRWRKGFFLDRF